MIPLRDDIPGDGAPPTALALCLLVIVAGVALPGGDPWTTIAAVIAVYLFAPSVVRDRNGLSALAIAVVGGLIAGAGAVAAGIPSGLLVGPGAAASLALTHLALHRGARILSLVPLPAAARVVAVPTPVVFLSWAVIVALLAAVAL